MEFGSILSPQDADRAERTFERLRFHNISSLVLTGGIALEFQLLRRGLSVQPRPFHDIDFLADSLDHIPGTLAADFWFRHVHPKSLPGQTLLQCADPATAVRVDVFRAGKNTMMRAEIADVCGAPLCMASLSDLGAHAARLCMDLSVGRPTPRKHAQYLRRMFPLLDADRIQQAWLDHRKPDHPQSFSEVADLLSRLLDERPDFLITPKYSQDADAACPRCEIVEGFPLAPGKRILGLLGYC